MELIDSHAHITDEDFLGEQNEVIEHAKLGGLSYIISAGCDKKTSLAALELASKNPIIFSTAGVHPENVADFDEFFAGQDEDFSKFIQNAKNTALEKIKEIEKIAQNKKCVAIGEIGLDYHFVECIKEDYLEKFGKSLSQKNVDELKALQKFFFEEQIELANKLSLPLVVHSRDAMGDTLEIFRAHKPQKPSLLHCYSGSIESAEILMKMGFSFSFGGVVTFKNAKNVQEVVRALPLDRILLETDCPYMSPEPFRGKRNEPKNVVYVADKIASLKGISIDEIAAATTLNAKKLFGLEDL